MRFCSRKRLCLVGTVILLPACGGETTVYTDSTGAEVLADCQDGRCRGVKDGLACGGDTVFAGATHIVACADINGVISDPTCRPIRCSDDKDCSSIYAEYGCNDGYCSIPDAMPSRATLVWLCIADVERQDGTCAVSDEVARETEELIESVCPADGTPYQVCPVIPKECELP